MHLSYRYSCQLTYPQRCTVSQRRQRPRFLVATRLYTKNNKIRTLNSILILVACMHDLTRSRLLVRMCYVVVKRPE